MGIIYRFDLQKGGGPWCAPHYVNGNGYAPTGGGTPFGDDPNYPDIVEAEAVKVTSGVGPGGLNVMETDPAEGEDEALAGIHISHQRLSLNTLNVKVCYRFTASAIADGIPYAPLFYLSSDFTFGNELILAAYIDGSDLRIEIGWDNPSGPHTFRHEYSRSVASLDTVNFAIFRVVGKNGSITSTGRLSDGFLKVYWDDTLIYDIQDIPLDIGGPGVSWIVSSDGDPDAIITDIGIGDSGLIGQFAWLEISDDISAFDVIDTAVCCADAPAPGGGSVSPGGTPSPNGPPIGTVDPPGGTNDPVTTTTFPGTRGPRSYTTFVGGGVLAAQSDPTDPQSLDSVITPVVSVELITADTVSQRWATSEVSAGQTSPPIKRKVLSYSEIVSEELSDRQGAIPSSTFSVTVDDKDGLAHGWMQGGNKYLLNRLAYVLAEAYSQRELDTAARSITYGYVSTWDFVDDFAVRFDFADLFSNGRSPLSLSKKFPTRVFAKTMFPKVPDTAIYGRPVPWYYGEWSDDYNWSIDHTWQPVGIIPGIPVGSVSSLKILNQKAPLNNFWHVYIHAGHAFKKYTSLFTGAGGQIDPLSRIRFTPDYQVVVDSLTQEQTSSVVLPGYPNWGTYFDGNYLRIQGTDGDIQDFAATLLCGPKSYYADTGQVTYSVNGWGVEDVGDSTGLCISNPAHQIAHYIAYGILSDYRYGSWPALPLYPNGRPKFRRSSVTTAAAVVDAMIEGGMQTSMVVGAVKEDIRSGAEILKDAQVGSGIQIGFDHFGSMFLDAFDPLQTITLTSLRLFDDSNIHNFLASAMPSLFKNVENFTYGPEPATGRISGELQTLVDQNSIDNNLERRGDSDQWVNTIARRKDVALAVGGRKLTYSSTVPILGSFETNLQGTSVRSGQIIRCTSERGLGTTGWTDRVLRVTSVVLLPNDADMRSRIVWEDVNDLLVVNSTVASIFPALGASRGRYWGQPVGLDSDGTSMPFGLDSNGTSRPLA